MQNDRTTNVKKGIIAGFINNVLAILLPFVSRTIIIYSLGTAYVGLGGLFTSILQVLNISELGFGGAISYLLYKPIAENDTKKICQLLSFTRICFRVIGTVVLVSGVVILPFIDKLTSGDRPPEMNVYILYVLYLANSVISYFMYSYKRVLFSACQRYDVETNINSITVIGQYVLQIVILLLTANYYLFVVMTIISSVANNILCQHETKMRFPEYICQGRIEEVDKKELIKTMKGVFVSKIGSTVFSSTTNIVVSAFFGLIVLGNFCNYNYVATSLVGLFAVIHNSLRPSIGNYIITQSKENNYDLLNKISLLYNWISAFCACCLLCLLQDFINVWLGEGSLFPSFYVILFAASFYCGRISCMPSIYVEAAGLWYESKFIYIIAAIVNVSLSIVLAYILGLPGILIASIITSLIVCSYGYIYVLFKHYFKSRSLTIQYIRTTFATLISQMFLIGVVYWCSLVFRINSWPMFFVKGLVVALAFIILFGLIALFDKNRSKEIIIYAKSIIKKR